MTVMYELRGRCLLCGYRLRGGIIRQIRINKNTIRAVPGVNLAWTDRACPECQTTTLGARFDERGLGAKDTAEVNAWRAKRGWAPLAPGAAA